MTFKSLTHESVKDLIETQLAAWPLAKKNYDALMLVKRKPFSLGSVEGSVQCNPARIVSTGAATDAASIAKRPCFLCEKNRPAEQFPVRIVEGWDLLVNPYPILPVHLTIVCREHKPQDAVPPAIVNFAEALPGMVVFFNGARAGASAPDHLHLQAVMKDELPLIRLVEERHTPDMRALLVSNNIPGDFPVTFFSGIVSPDEKGMKILDLAFNIGGLDEDGSFTDKSLVNAYFWIADNGLLRFIIIPRRAHRPKCYFKEGKEQRIVSPGAIDMTGLIIAPREEDFKALSDDEIREIYNDVAIPIDLLKA